MSHTLKLLTLIQCMCVLWIANVLWLAVYIEGGNDTSICTD